jgi:hypothetical protein
MAVWHGWELLTRLSGEAINDLKKILKRRTPHIDITRRIQQKAYFKALRNDSGQ